jgi:toxin ParE1/3/4
MKVEFADEPKAEIRSARERYEGERTGLGREFVLEVREVIRRIADDPLHFQKVARTKARRAVVSRFPYDVFFVVGPERVRIIAIGHQDREPGYWKRRV